MIGTKKLRTIHEEIERAFASSGADPIQRLEGLIAAAKSKGDRTEVLEGLKRFLQSPHRKRRRHQKAEKKSRRGRSSTR